MMSVIFMLMFMIPLSNLKNKYWLNQYLYILMSFMFIFKLKLHNLFCNISYLFMCDTCDTLIW